MSKLITNGLRHLGSATDNVTLTSGGGFSTRGITDNATSTALTIDASGRILKPNTPAFYAMMNNTNISSTAAIIFNNVHINVGGHYNNANGRFTAPVAGTYMFSTNALKRSGSGRLYFTKNDVYYGSGTSQTYSGSLGTGEVTHAASIIISLVAGDYINVIAQIDSGDFYGSPNSHNSFGGFLIG